jgi:hypothetical protein
VYRLEGRREEKSGEGAVILNAGTTPVAPATIAPAVAPINTKSPGELLVLQSIAGAGSGALTKTATAPLERVKIIFQVQVREATQLVLF